MGMPIGSIVQVSARGSINSQNTITTWTYRAAGMATVNTVAAELDALLADFQIDANGTPYLKFLDVCPSNYSVDFLTAQVIVDTRSALRKVVPGAAAGNRGASNFQQSNPVITRSTSLAGRSQISTMHVPGIADADSVSGEIIAALSGRLEDLCVREVGTLTPLLTPNFVPVIYHRGKVPNFDDITTCVPQPTTRTMRRRVVGLGI